MEVENLIKLSIKLHFATVKNTFVNCHVYVKDIFKRLRHTNIRVTRKSGGWDNYLVSNHNFVIFLSIFKPQMKINTICLFWAIQNGEEAVVMNIWRKNIFNEIPTFWRFLSYSYYCIESVWKSAFNKNLSIFLTFFPCIWSTRY